MFLWDAKRLWVRVLVLGVVWAGGTWLGISKMILAFFLQCMTIGYLGILVDGDRACRWERYMITVPQGRRWYAAEKGIVLVLLWLVSGTAAMLLTGGKAWQTIRDPFWVTCLFGLSALHFPAVVLCSRTKRNVWEILTVTLGMVGTYFLQNGMILAFRKALKAGEIPEQLTDLHYIAWQDVPWNGLAAAAAVLFVLSVAGTIWLAGNVNRNEGLRSERVCYVPHRRFLYHTLPLIVIAAGYVTMAVLAAQMSRPYERIYSKENSAGETSYMITNMDEDRIAEKYPTDNWKLAAKYPIRQYKNEDGTESRTRIYDVLGGICLVWDREWLLWDMETGEKTTLSLPVGYDGYTTVQLLGDTEPIIVGLMNEEHTAAGFYSIQQGSMITGWDFHHWGDDLIDGQIAARIGQYEEERWYLVDPITGEITGTLPGRP